MVKPTRHAIVVAALAQHGQTFANAFGVGP